MIVHRHRHRPLGIFLANDVGVQKFFYLAGGGDGGEEGLGVGELALFLADDVVGQIDAVGADVNVGGSFDYRADITGGFAAEGASGHASTPKSARRIVCVALIDRRHIRRNAAVAGAIGSGHSISPSSSW